MPSPCCNHCRNSEHCSGKNHPVPEVHMMRFAAPHLGKMVAPFSVAGLSGPC